MSRDQFTWLGVLLLGSIIALAFLPPIHQSQDYHNFADQRGLAGVPNFLNVLTNLPFVLVGIAGIGLCLRRGAPVAPLSWFCFFSAFALVGSGSAYYHWAPSDATLMWDRLPITLAFMSIFSAVLNDTLLPNSERRLLPSLLALGVLSVLWWRYSDDLRLYGWVQFAPLLFIAFLSKFHGFRHIRGGYLYAAFSAYVLAKIFEALDLRIYELTAQWVSGHSLKHLAAAASGYILYRMLRQHETAQGPRH
jgi:hypothetical protein